MNGGASHASTDGEKTEYSESLEEIVYVPWSIHTGRNHRKEESQTPGQMDLSDFLSENISGGEPVSQKTAEVPAASEKSAVDIQHIQPAPTQEVHPQKEPLPIIHVPTQPEPANVPEKQT